MKSDYSKLRPTIKDVAKLAGVSLKTVSNVINNNSSRFSDETREKVLAALETLNYRPNQAARYMRSGRIGILALAIPDIGNPYFAAVAGHIIAAAKIQGYTVLIDHTEGQAEQELLMINSLTSQTVDGLILNPMILGEEAILPEREDFPIVLLGERAMGARYDHIVIDNVAAARLATQHLIDLGRRHIAVIGVPDDARDVMPRLRYQGYLEALEAANIALDEELIANMPPASFTYRDGALCMRQLLDTGRPLDAVFCLNDRVALGAMRVLKENGVRIPDDVAVIGFDNIEEGYFAMPSLTTIAPDKKNLGEMAVSLLLDRIHRTKPSPQLLYQPPFKLVIRESTAGINVTVCVKDIETTS
ncbi:MAG: LacI family DNA-binding transcriptional regulator [Chloroflexota bacterium]